MTKKIALLLLPFILISCNGLGPKRVKNIVELTPKLAIQTHEPIYLDSNANIYAFNANMLKNKQYSFARSKTITEPVFIGDMIYALDIRSNISAFSIEKNKIIWSYNLSRHKKDNYIGGGILHHNGKLYVTYGSRLLVVLDAKSGYEIIRKELPDIIRIKPIVLNDNTVLVQTISNQTIALNAETLKTVWEHESLAEVLSASYFMTPIVQYDNVIVTYNSGQILALNITNGEVKWNFEFANLNDRTAIPNFDESSILCTPVHDNMNLYIATGLGKLIKLNVATGSVIWQVNAEDIQSMSLIGNSLFVTNNARQIAAFNPETGKVKFVADLNDGQDPKKLKSAAFLVPFVGVNNNNKRSLNVISVNGVLYSFDVDNNGLNRIPHIVKIIKNIRYYGLRANNNLYFSTDRKIIFGSK
ncbi:outer membrane protein assembly factor BamB [Rickettsia conorii subsp. heilongjiangensis]|uniref:Outer membrane protein assembly factor BamB n=1 Tax=Rickettsia conorii subsp. heilongjiangensis TaxID=226665 RepID=A0AAD1GI98_RICCR|nr:outer membrane protein assembly factor BamB [Rickettsia conorii]AEK74356.1 WD-40 repeat-containing protein [Rickettsia conorii subsp. heilongjiangensis 054]UZW38979.1 outer membrane protein assembly factor BamB [Rickettsia conorii subsp. heilongjiangensis]BBM91133.1 outer membrane protein assembly factor BamB [Rickettsia conorii subsp. heilongjiangensis]BBM92342.1 outer membrane protein assembly factor BamB [Rickettsia conorii subsp. heilongjiangensis]BBM93551.1 outer membrane protein assem